MLRQPAETEDAAVALVDYDDGDRVRGCRVTTEGKTVDSLPLTARHLP